MAQGLTGEIAPFRVDSLGVERPFSLYVRPEFNRRDPGFDQLLLVAPADMALGFAGLYAGQSGDEHEVEGVEVIPTGADSLHLSFAEIRPNTDVEVVRLDFRTVLFGMGAVLRASLQHSTGGEDTWQRVDPGNALDEVAGNTTTLVGDPTRGELLLDVEVRPPGVYCALLRVAVDAGGLSAERTEVLRTVAVAY